MKDKDRESEVRGQRSARLRIFEVPECFGCGEPTLHKYRNLPLCVPCEQECTLLNTLYSLPSGPERSAIVRFRRMCRRAGKWLWVPNLVFVGGALLYLGWIFGQAFIEWIEQGGMQ